MIWRLTYCNKKGVEARVDIIKGDRTPVEIVKGTGNPFTISYRLDKNDKSGHIMTSSADIEIFETETFNIDDLKTSNETELKVEYFEGNVLTWVGFILPDFFSREIGSPNIVRMTASDRLTALKGVTLSDLPTRVSLRDLIESSLEQTGLDLALVAQVQINQGSTNILDSEILSQRLTDTRGRSISCYDILMSIMVATNSTIRQREGQWVVYNKLEHELRTPTIFFDKVERGAIRTIQPVASSVGVYNEFGGGRSYPDNYDFSDGLTGWTAVNGFVATIDNRKVDNFVSGTGVIPQEWTTNPVYGDATEKNYLVNDNYGIDYDFADKPYLKSSNIPVTYPSESQINVNVLVNATGPFIDSDVYRGETNFAVIASNGTKTLHLGASGAFEPLTGDPFLHKVTFDGDTHLQAVSSSKSVNGVLSVEEGNLSGYNITVRLYGYTKGVTGGRFLVTTLVNSVIVTFKNLSDAPKGNLYKTTQGSNFTKQHDIETVIFGDYIATGLNGYFYKYPIDDTSNLFLPNGELASPAWATIFDTTERPLLHHISRQKSRLFSVAHDILRANINVESFDPLAVFQDCKGGKYVVVSASFDFLRSEVDVELEQIAYDNTILKRDFIYSYFGEGESNIKSIGGIAGGGGGTGGGGMTSEQLEMLTNLASWWKLDEENDAVYSEKNVYSLKGVSALGLGSEGGGGGGADMLDSWANYTEAKADYYVPASLLVPFRDDTLSRLTSLEAGGGAIDIEIATTGTGNAITSLTKSGSVITANKGLTFALSSHTHTFASLTNKPTTLAGYGITDAATLSAFNAHVANKANPHAVTTSQIGAVDLTTNQTIGGAKTFTGNVTAPTFIGALSGNAASATNLGRSVLAGNGLTGGGELNANRTLTLGTPSDITATSTNSVTASSHTHKLSMGSGSGLDADLLDGYHASSLLKDITTNYAATITSANNYPTNLLSGIHRTHISNVEYASILTGYDYAGKYWQLRFRPSYNRNIYYRNNASTAWSTIAFTDSDITGNAATATKLQTARTIAGVSFDGTANIAIPFANLASKPTTLSGYGITDAVTLNTAQTITGAKTFSALLTASTGVNTPKVDLGNGFTIEPSGTELVFKYNGVIKQRMLSDGTILATGGVTALATS